MAKRTTAVSLKRSCAHQRAQRNLFKHVFTCQRPQLYINQVPRRSMQRQPSYRRDGQTDGRTDRRIVDSRLFLYVLFNVHYIRKFTCYHDNKNYYLYHDYDLDNYLDY